MFRQPSISPLSNAFFHFLAFPLTKKPRFAFTAGRERTAIFLHHARCMIKEVWVGDFKRLASLQKTICSCEL